MPVHLRVWNRAAATGVVKDDRGCRERGAVHWTRDQQPRRGEIRLRIAAFAVDDEKPSRIPIAFDKDSKDRKYPVTGDVLRSNRNGRIDGQILIPLDAGNELLQGQESRNGFLSYYATTSGPTGAGKLRSSFRLRAMMLEKAGSDALPLRGRLDLRSAHGPTLAARPIAPAQATSAAIPSASSGA